MSKNLAKKKRSRSAAGRYSKAKGSSFERVVAKMIATILCAGDDKVFRTPGSGGHTGLKAEFPGDVQIHRRFRRLFPFVVEAKHRAWIRLDLIFSNSEIPKYCRQASIDAASYKKARYHPLVVIRGKNTKIYCLWRYRKDCPVKPSECDWSFRIANLIYQPWHGGVWYGTEFKEFLRVVEGKI